MAERRMGAEVNDRFATEFQETGIASAAMLPLADVIASVDALGIDPREVVLLGTVFTTEEGGKVIDQAEATRAAPREIEVDHQGETP